MPDACPETVVADTMQPSAEFDVPELLRGSMELQVQTLVRLAPSLWQSGTDEGQVRSVVDQFCALDREDLVAAIGTGAADLAERLRGRLADAAVETNGIALTVTGSFGVCSLDRIGGVAEWLQAADDRLYEAKASGRNCCRCG